MQRHFVLESALNFNKIKLIRLFLLQDSDYIMQPDYTVDADEKALWVTYRQWLRDILTKGAVTAYDVWFPITPTEYIARKVNCSKKEVMLIYNEKLSVSPITTHIPIRKVNKNISIDKIVKNVLTINKFYKNKLKIIPKIAVTGLNPHCESSDFASEEKKIIIPAIKKLQRKKILN